MTIDVGIYWHSNRNMIISVLIYGLFIGPTKLRCDVYLQVLVVRGNAAVRRH